MTLYKNKYRVESARLKGWDYSSPGYYFITIVTKNRDHWFGKIVNGKMILSKMGEIAEHCWREIPHHFPFVILDEFVVMPDHIHGIIVIEKSAESMECPRTDAKGIFATRTDAKGIFATRTDAKGIFATRTDAINRVCTGDGDRVCTGDEDRVCTGGGITGEKNPMFHQNISRIIRWFKGRTTFEIRNSTINHIDVQFAWQPRFYDRIIRNDRVLNRIRQYIINNPLQWDKDENNQMGVAP